MTIFLSQTYTAVTANIISSFHATGGTAPYTFSVLPGGAGGTIDPVTGIYTAPSIVDVVNPNWAYDTIQVVDHIGATTTKQILVGTPLMLFCDILATQVGLPSYDRVYLWDQKIMQPTDSGMYIAVSVPMCKSFSNTNEYTTDGSGNYLQVQSTNMRATVDVDITSRDCTARDRKEEIILALNSTYAQQQQSANSFYIGKVPTNFINLSQVDGAAIPYRFKISVQMQYSYTKILGAPYFDTFSAVQTYTNP